MSKTNEKNPLLPLVGLCEGDYLKDSHVVGQVLLKDFELYALVSVNDICDFIQACGYDGREKVLFTIRICAFINRVAIKYFNENGR